MNETSNENPVSDLDLLKSSVEQKVNFIRITAIAIFYLIHLWHVSAARLGATTASFIGFDANQPMSPNAHIAISLLCFGWLMQAFGIHFMAHNRLLPDRLITGLTIADIMWLTAILCVSTGAAGPMVIGYFLIIVLTGIRFDLRLIRFATVAAIVGYLAVLGVAKWPVGWIKEFEIQTVPRYHQLMIVVALAFCGVTVGQIVRHAYIMTGALNKNRSTGDSS